jgi:formamidopyrimidine-DNA glycosylase
MPELPEVETIKRGLVQRLARKPRITAIELKCGDLRRPVREEELGALVGQRLTAVTRRAKYLVFVTEKFNLVNHLGMTGSWRFEKGGGHLKHDHFVMTLSDKTKLIYNDPRRFGLLRLVETGSDEHAAVWGRLGPEPLERDFDSGYLWKQTRGCRSSIKAWLMDQRRVVGVGNIYASEALFQAGIRPRRQAGRIKQAECKSLVTAVRRVLNSAIDSGGSTIRDYRNATGSEGGFQNLLSVYGRGGDPCRHCKNRIASNVLAGRSTFWCPRCQK